VGLFARRKRKPEEPAAAPAPAPVDEAPDALPAASDDGEARRTANEWAKELNFNEVAAERAAMRAGKWHARFTEAEFLDLVRTADV
jgi:hypothetical protein